MTRTYTIGQVSRLSGIPTRRVRFYADEGLLTPTARTGSGYRIFSEADLIRLDLIRALREAGAGFEMIRSVLARQMSLKQVLEVRLAEVETHVASQQRVAATLRLALKSPEPSNDDLRRVSAMIDVSLIERRRAVRGFYDKVTDGLGLDPKWKLRMVEFHTPELPDDPSTQQIEAWIELSKLLDDEAFQRMMRASVADIDTIPKADAASGSKLNIETFMENYVEVRRRTREAIEAGASPDSDTGAAIAGAELAARAKNSDQPCGEAFLARQARQAHHHVPNLKRFRELVATLRSGPDYEPKPEEVWLQDALRHYLRPYL